MSKTGEEPYKKPTTYWLLKSGFVGGIGWAFGVTIGFVIVSTIVVVVLRSLGGLPLIGSFLANIVEETQAQLIRRTPVFR